MLGVIHFINPNWKDLNMKNQQTLLASLCAAALLVVSPVASADGVSGLSTTPSKGTSATNFKINIQGAGQCAVSIATSKDGADGWVKTLTENLPTDALPRDWVFNPPTLLGSKATKGNLPVGTYTVWAKSTGTNCSMSEKAVSFEVAPVVNLAPLPKCADGWVLAAHDVKSGEFTCKPKKPTAQICPPKQEWFDDGCTAGCRKLVY